jgi:hypothetical protein
MASVTIWNRIEPRARSQDLTEGLAARVHDPLWFLARQWQMGEFAGRNTGSPVTVSVTSTATPFDRYTTGSEAARPYDGTIPLEALVERETVRPQTAGTDLWQTMEAGLQFFRMLDAANLSRLRPTYLTQYPLAPGTDASLQPIAALAAGRVVDAVKLRADLVQAGSALPAQPALSAADRQSVLRVAQAWCAWYESLFSEPAGADSWSPVRMEYGFALGSTVATTQWCAVEYDGGAADWYTFDRAAAATTTGQPAPTPPKPATRSGMAAPVIFRGMPARRFWEMEDAAVDIGALSAAAEDIGRLLLREFALIYGNDWFQIPLTVPVGSEVAINALSVVDTFGVTTPIPHYVDFDGAAGGWHMFALAAANVDAAAASAHLLVVTPAVVAPNDGAAIEDVLMLRDEPANMVWGVERTAVGPAGAPVDRALAWKTAAPVVPPPAAGAALSYRLGSTVPDYWIPFLPVKVNGGPLQMRRGKLPTAATGPLGRLLAYPGLTIFLEELPREGVHLQRRYRSARGPDGSTSVWIGRLRSTGTGEGRSGLRFDYLE